MDPKVKVCHLQEIIKGSFALPNLTWGTGVGEEYGFLCLSSPLEPHVTPPCSPKFFIPNTLNCNAGCSRWVALG